MSNIFLRLLNISITAGWIVLVVVLLRFVLKKAPKWMRVVLWGLVALRLLLPVSIESPLSLVPSEQTVSIATWTLPDTAVGTSEESSAAQRTTAERVVFQTGFPALNSAINPTMKQSYEHHSTVSTVKTVAGWVWLIGVVGMLLYALISFLRLRHRVRASVKFEKGAYVCDEISDPFILGLIVPKIYLPSSMDEQTRAYVLAHEKAHLSRFDHIWKPLGFLLLSVYWFNPLLWLAYILLCRDIELACDEKVVKELDDTGKAAYSEALVTASVSRRSIAACPLAFGETGVKSRVKSILNYKKPAFWIILVALLAGIVTAVCFLTVPKKEEPVPAYAPIRYTEAALEVIENDGLLSEENFEDLSNFVRVLYNCGIVPFSQIECVDKVEELRRGYYLIKCSCDNQAFSIEASRSEDSQRKIFMWFLTEDGEDGSAYYIYHQHYRDYFADETDYENYIKYREEIRQISLTVLEEHCGFTEEEAFGLMQEIDLLFYVDRIPFDNIASIEKAERRKNTISLSLTSNIGDSYTVVISTVNRPIILSITDTEGKVLYTSKEKEYPFAVLKASPVPSDKVVQWLDYYDASSKMPWEETKEIAIDAFTNIRFRWTSGSVEAVENGTTRTLFTGMPIWNVFIADITRDGNPELCATVSFGSGIVDEHIVVYDYANRQSYTLWDRGTFDYHLYTENGALLVGKTLCNSYSSDTSILDTGMLTWQDGLLCCRWSDGSFVPLNRELHESELYGEWLVEEETDNDDNVLYQTSVELWKEYRFQADGTVTYNETVPISSDYEKAFGHPVEYSYTVHDGYVHIEDGRSTSGYLDPQTGKLELNYQPSPGQYVYQTLRRMGEDLPEADAEATPAPELTYVGTWELYTAASFYQEYSSALLDALDVSYTIILQEDGTGTEIIPNDSESKEISIQYTADGNSLTITLMDPETNAAMISYGAVYDPQNDSLVLEDLFETYRYLRKGAERPAYLREITLDTIVGTWETGGIQVVANTDPVLNGTIEFREDQIATWTMNGLGENTGNEEFPFSLDGNLIRISQESEIEIGSFLVYDSLSDTIQFPITNIGVLTYTRKQANEQSEAGTPANSAVIDRALIGTWELIRAEDSAPEMAAGIKTINEQIAAGNYIMTYRFTENGDAEVYLKSDGSGIYHYTYTTEDGTIVFIDNSNRTVWSYSFDEDLLLLSKGTYTQVFRRIAQ